jgi:hypothetical protein
MGDLLRWPRDTLYPLKLALTSPTSGGRSVGIVRLRTQATEFQGETNNAEILNPVRYLMPLRKFSW